MREAQEIISKMDLTRAYQVTKAFATYFELTNLAETNHRKRRRRAGKLDRDHAPSARLVSRNVAADERGRNLRRRMRSQRCGEITDRSGFHRASHGSCARRLFC